jgi:hypothetical protein
MELNELARKNFTENPPSFSVMFAQQATLPHTDHSQLITEEPTINEI